MVLLGRLLLLGLLLVCCCCCWLCDWWLCCVSVGHLVVRRRGEVGAGCHTARDARCASLRCCEPSSRTRLGISSSAVEAHASSG